MKKAILILPFLALIALTILSLLPEKAGVLSLFLTTELTEDDNTIRSDYVDEDGRITYASNLKYATIIKAKEDGRVVLEEYFDENGKPAASNNNSAAISHTYNDKEQTEWIHYLDVSGKPVVISSGYDSIHRSYNEDGLAETDTYYIGGQQVEHNDEFYGFKRAAYNDQYKPVELQYLDQNGELKLQKNGYAIINREYWDDTWLVKRDFYFDVDGRPVADQDGKFGYYREYDDKEREVLTTYLDADGMPMNGRIGYATIRTEYENGAVKKLYYDKDGNPTTIGRNQYGTETVDGRTHYLNADGSRMLRIDNFMYNEPLLVMIIGIILTVLTLFVKNCGRLILLFVSIAIIIIMTLLFRETGAADGQILIFRSFENIFKSRTTMHNVINNIWLFVPLGAILYKHGSLRWLIPIIASITIELLQLAFGIGVFEVTDIICNSIGGLIGYGFFAARYCTPRYEEKNVER